MMRMRVVRTETEGIRAKASRALRHALDVTAENVLADCTSYVPYDTGALQGSGRTRLGDSTAYVEWGGTAKTAAYARKQYYEHHNHDTTQNALFAPHATDHWYEKCAAVRGSAWHHMFDQTFKQRM